MKGLRGWSTGSGVLFERRLLMHEIGNIIEAVFWGVIALVFARWALAMTGNERRTGVIASVAIALFGLSDVVEVYTGAWWRPWWLLTWKGLCIGVFAWLLYGHYRDRRNADGHAGPGSPD